MNREARLYRGLGLPHAGDGLQPQCIAHSAHGRYGILTEPLDARGFAEALLTALAQPERLAQMGRPVRRMCRNAGWEQTAGAIAAHICADLRRTAAPAPRSAQA